MNFLRRTLALKDGDSTHLAVFSGKKRVSLTIAVGDWYNMCVFSGPGIAAVACYRSGTVKQNKEIQK